MLQGEKTHCACIKNCRPVRPAHVRAVNHHTIHRSLPKAPIVDVRHGDDRLGVKFGGIHSTKSHLTIVLAVCKARDLIGDNGVLD